VLDEGRVGSCHRASENVNSLPLFPVQESSQDALIPDSLAEFLRHLNQAQDAASVNVSKSVAWVFERDLGTMTS
jgi:hypothetical protein